MKLLLMKIMMRLQNHISVIINNINDKEKQEGV